MSSLIDFVGDVVSTVLVGDSHDVERLYLLTRDRRVIKLTLQFSPWTFTTVARIFPTASFMRDAKCPWANGGVWCGENT